MRFEPANESHAEFICELRNNLEETTRFLANTQIHSIDNCKEWISSLPSSSERIVVYDGINIVGLIRLDNIDFINQNCCVGLDILPKERGRGCSKRVYSLLLDYLFNYLNMYSVWLEVIANNVVAIKLYEKLGFKECGRKHNFIYRDGERWDYITMELFREEYFEKKN